MIRKRKLIFEALTIHVVSSQGQLKYLLIRNGRTVGCTGCSFRGSCKDYLVKHKYADHTWTSIQTMCLGELRGWYIFLLT